MVCPFLKCASNASKPSPVFALTRKTGTPMAIRSISADEFGEVQCTHRPCSIQLPDVRRIPSTAPNIVRCAAR